MSAVSLRYLKTHRHMSVDPTVLNPSDGTIESLRWDAGERCPHATLTCPSKSASVLHIEYGPADEKSPQKELEVHFYVKMRIKYCHLATLSGVRF